MRIDTNYLARIEGKGPEDLLREPMFLDAQKLFFDVVTMLGGRVDFEIADMREVHAVASLFPDIRGKRVLDVGCGSVEHYVLNDDFRDRYPPFLAEMLTRCGATVTGIDIRPHPAATYDHRTLDLTDPLWTRQIDTSYDMIACLSLFNAPESPFEHDRLLCDRLMDAMRELLAPDGILIMTLRDDLAPKDYGTSLATHGLALLVSRGNTAWAKRA